ncbi:MAG: 50S ribosomal protein L3 [Parcubacteria group bacterium]|nr:50S ribosomal protein L3 [Parcubacteria group bacterium]
MKFILGTKEEMTQIFQEDGRVVPVTAISAGPIVVTQVKNTDTDGYTAVQVGFGAQKESRLGKSILGHTKDLGAFKTLREFRIEDTADMEKGKSIDVSIFEPGEEIEVSGISKGKGFQGVVKRHGFKGGPRTHGQKHSERKPGSIGSTGPQRVFKGVRMAGRMGSDRTTVKNLSVVAVDAEKGLLFVKGAVPGRRGTLLEVRTA